MFANCAYAAGVWHRTSTWSQLQLPTTNMHTSVRRWWRLILQAGATDMESSLQIIIYMVWNLWKEMCRRGFQNKGLTEELAAMVKTDVVTFNDSNMLV
jgi:hypothetical protein